MKLIADSGSTKTDWVLISPTNQVISSFSTLGLNPVYYKEEFILDQLKFTPIKSYLSDIGEVVFFGAEWLNTTGICQ